jgi:hypothetical protein
LFCVGAKSDTPVQTIKRHVVAIAVQTNGACIAQTDVCFRPRVARLPPRRTLSADLREFPWWSVADCDVGRWCRLQLGLLCIRRARPVERGELSARGHRVYVSRVMLQKQRNTAWYYAVVLSLTHALSPVDSKPGASTDGMYMLRG